MTAQERERLRLALLKMGESRKELLTNYAGTDPEYRDVRDLSRFLRAMCLTVARRRKTELRGFGVFEWKPCKGRTPTGKEYDSWRLVCRFHQKMGHYNGNR